MKSSLFKVHKSKGGGGGGGGDLLQLFQYCQISWQNTGVIVYPHLRQRMGKQLLNRNKNLCAGNGVFLYDLTQS